MSLHSTDLFEQTHTIPPRHSVVRPSRPTKYENLPKRLIDVALVLCVLPIALPLVVVMSCLVSLDGGLPFFCQKRIGRGGRVFRMWKMRTMVQDADAKMTAYLASNPAARAEWDSTQKLKNDPRITRIGQVLRRTSLDELPQLWNVLNGTMSLVGPRPMMVNQRQIYTGTSYYRLRPGITGLWQISDRNECSFVNRVAYDDAYAGMLSFGLDLRILLRTVRVVLRATGY